MSRRFRKQNILRAFLLESLFLGIIGGVIGLGFASLMQFLSISTMNWQTFAEFAFSFKLNAAIILKSLLFALIMGFAGGFLPAARAARMNGCAQSGLGVRSMLCYGANIPCSEGLGDLKLHFFKAGLRNALFNV